MSSSSPSSSLAFGPASLSPRERKLLSNASIILVRSRAGDCHNVPGPCYGKPTRRSCSRVRRGLRGRIRRPVGPESDADQETCSALDFNQIVNHASPTGKTPRWADAVPICPGLLSNLTARGCLGYRAYLKSLPVVKNAVPGPTAARPDGCSFPSFILRPSSRIAERRLPPN